MSVASLPRRVARAIAVVLTLAWASAVVVALAARRAEPGYLVRLLTAEGTVERGALAADERLSPFPTSGQVGWRQSLAGSPPAGSSAAANVWRFYVTNAGVAAPGERVFVSPPAELLVYFGNFLWYPARLEVGPPSGRALTASDALRAEAWQRPPNTDLPAELARLGYRHAVLAEPEGLRLIGLPPESGER